MDVNTIRDLGRTLTHTDSDQITDIQALQYLNIVYHNVANAIMEIDEDYFWDIFTTSTVLDQNEYSFQTATSTQAGMKKIQRIQVKWRSTDSFQTLVPSDTLANYPTSTDRINTNFSTAEGFFDIKDGSMFVFPAPAESVTGGLEVQATSTLIDLVAAGTESTVFPRNSELRDYHQVLSIGMKQYIYSQQGLTSEKNDSINEYKAALNDMLETVKDRFFNPVVAILPNAINLKN